MFFNIFYVHVHLYIYAVFVEQFTYLLHN